MAHRPRGYINRAFRLGSRRGRVVGSGDFPDCRRGRLGLHEEQPVRWARGTVDRVAPECKPRVQDALGSDYDRVEPQHGLRDQNVGVVVARPD